MERLTTDELYCDFVDCDADPDLCGVCEARKRWERLQAYERTGLEPETIRGVVQAILNLESVKGYDYLKSLVRADAEGRLVVLPCKVGDTVYEVHNNTDACLTCIHFSSWFGTDALCDRAELSEKDCYYPNCADRPVCEQQFMEVVEYKPTLNQIFDHRERFGATIFLTREEAKAALAKEVT